MKHFVLWILIAFSSPSLGGPPRNFGVVINNDTYQIYRSGKLGKHGLKKLANYLYKEGLPFPKTIVYMNKQGYAFPFYFAIQEYKEQERYGFTFYHPFGKLRTYLDGQDPYQPTDVIDRSLYLGHVGRKYFDYGDGKVAGGVETLLLNLVIILEPVNQPVLFHCFGGFHRTGIVAMLIRYMQGWEEKDIIAEYHKYNPSFPREKNIDFVKAFSQDERFLELKRIYHLGN